MGEASVPEFWANAQFLDTIIMLFLGTQVAPEAMIGGAQNMVNLGVSEG